MGFTRLYLALCVVAAHSSPLVPWSIHGGTEAVQIFFMISGFYMSLICDKYPTTREFYASRFLKIYFTYWLICVFIIFFSVIAGIATGKWLALGGYRDWSPRENSLFGVILATMANIGLFGSDWILFLVDEPGNPYRLATQVDEMDHPLGRYLLIGPAWSLGVELCFYLVTPLLNRLTTLWLGILLCVSLALRVIAYEYFGFKSDPWDYRFMPFELALFIGGMLSCRLYKLCLGNKRIHWPVKWLPLFVSYASQAILFLAAYRLTFGLIELVEPFASIQYARLASYVLWCPLLALLFHLTRENSLDRSLGELSFPLYLTHYFIVGVVAAAYTRLNSLPNSMRGLIVATLAIGVSILLEQVFVARFEAGRRMLAARLARAGSA